ncbi:MAG: rhomboid family intramembrane serine protease [Bacteroidota bacterium]
MSRLTDVVKNLIIINVIIFFGSLMLSDLLGNAILYGRLYFVESPNFRPFQIVTSMFLHADLGHLFMNMLGLFFLGPVVEQTLGGKRFLILYLLAGLGGSFLHMGVDYIKVLNMGCVECIPYDNLIRTGALGASGCVFGVVVAFITMFPREKLILFPIPIPIRAMFLGLGLVGFSLFAGITDTTPGGIGHFAHLGGAIVGFIMIHYWKMANLR